MDDRRPAQLHTGLKSCPVQGVHRLVTSDLPAGSLPHGSALLPAPGVQAQVRTLGVSVGTDLGGLRYQIRTGHNVEINALCLLPLNSDNNDVGSRLLNW